MNNEKKREIAQKAMISMVESKHPAIANETWEGLAIDACEAAEAISNEMDKRWPNTSESDMKAALDGLNPQNI